MTNVKVASMNKVKAEAIKTAFERYFIDVEVESYEVSSGVPEQPTNNCVFDGARHRLQELKKICKEYDYLVSCESGLIYQCGHWFNVQVVLVENLEGKSGIGVSQGYEVPAKYIPEVINTDISQLFDRLFEGKGGTRVLTKNQFTRKALIQDGTSMALVSVLNGDVW